MNSRLAILAGLAATAAGFACGAPSEVERLDHEISAIRSAMTGSCDNWQADGPDLVFQDIPSVLPPDPVTGKYQWLFADQIGPCNGEGSTLTFDLRDKPATSPGPHAVYVLQQVLDCTGSGSGLACDASRGRRWVKRARIDGTDNGNGEVRFLASRATDFGAAVIRGGVVIPGVMYGHICLHRVASNDGTPVDQGNVDQFWGNGIMMTIPNDNSGGPCQTWEMFTARTQPIDYVPNSLPIAAFSFTCNGLTCSFTDQGTDVDGTIGSRVWSFGDNTPNSTAQNPVHPYAGNGTYTVTLTVTDNEGGTGGRSEPVLVGTPSNSPPTAEFAFSCQGLTCSFTDQSTDADGIVTAWSWNFGDGATSTLRNPVRTYLAAGQYTVTLTATDDDGAASPLRSKLIAPIVITSPDTLPPGTVGQGYSYTLQAAGGPGGGRTWTLTGGALPPGFALATSGVVTGTASGSGTYSFAATVTAGAQSASKPFSLRINQAPNPVFSVTIKPMFPLTGGLQKVRPNQVCTWRLLVTGDPGPYTYLWEQNTGGGWQSVGTAMTLELGTGSVSFSLRGTATHQAAGNSHSKTASVGVTSQGVWCP